MYPTSGAISAVASRAGLVISYPSSRAFPTGQTNVTSTKMTFLFAGFPHVTLGAARTFWRTRTRGCGCACRGTSCAAGRALVYGASAVNGLAYYT